MNKLTVPRIFKLSLICLCFLLLAPHHLSAEVLRASCGGKATMKAVGEYTLAEQHEILQNAHVFSTESSEDVYRDEQTTVRTSTASFQLEKDGLGSETQNRIEEYTVACTFSCSGQSCSQSGCRATLQGCSEFSCTGTGCTGSCSGSSGIRASD